MKSLKYILYTCLFFLVGELIVRIEMKYDLLSNRPKTIEVKIEETELRNKVEQGKFAPKSNQTRILVIGDSYIYGGGISNEKKFSKRLFSLLYDTLQEDVLILDVSRPSNTTLDNYNSFKYYYDRFKPQFVFWAYNFNDILYSLKEVHTSESTEKTPPKRISKQRDGLKKYVLQLYSFSELTRYLSTNLQKQLKFQGIVLPIGDFYHLTQKVYTETNENWMDTKNKLDMVSQICKTNQSKFILYRMPEFNLLNHPNLFHSIDKELINYVNYNKNIIYHNGLNDFLDENGYKFMLSKFDGHPNQLAHFRIAKNIADYIIIERARTHNILYK